MITIVDKENKIKIKINLAQEKKRKSVFGAECFI